MKKTLLATAVLIATIGAALASIQLEGGSVVTPAKISAADMTGSIFDRSNMIEMTEDGNTTLDVTTLLSSDKKFASGMYQSQKVRFEVTEPYGVDEFMYFIKGSVTLTSADGSVLVINAGEAVTIPKEWTGTWDTEGYIKIWVIYSEDGSGL